MFVFGCLTNLTMEGDAPYFLLFVFKLIVDALVQTLFLNRMRLIDYISFGKVPFQENIYLLNNDNFPGNIPHCVDWPSTKSKALSSKIRRKITNVLSLEEKCTFRLPDKESTIFFGRTDRSTDRILELKRLFRLISRKKNNQYTVLLGKGDYTFEQSLLDLMPSNINKIFVNNLNIKDKRLLYFPMGRDFRSKHLFEDFNSQPNKKYLVYCNFSINTHPVRSKIYEMVKNKSYITSDHMGEFLKYSISREEFYAKLSSSKFAICPRGNAIDTFRLWDCLYLGAVPIVLKEAVFHQELIDLPILFLDNINDFQKLTADCLEGIYSEMLLKDWNYDKLKLSFWMSRVRA